MSSDLADRSDRGQQYRGPSQLFLLRVWLDDASSEHDLHGRIQHAVTGEAHYFRTCAELRCVILDMMALKSDEFTHEP